MHVRLAWSFNNNVKFFHTTNKHTLIYYAIDHSLQFQCDFFLNEIKKNMWIEMTEKVRQLKSRLSGFWSDNVKI